MAEAALPDRRSQGIARAILARNDNHPHGSAIFQAAEQHLVGKRLLDMLLDDAGHGPRAHRLIVTMLDQPVARLIRKLDGNFAFGKLGIELHDDLSTTCATTSIGKWPKAMTASSRLRNSGVNMRFTASISSPSRRALVKPKAAFCMSDRTGIGRHDQDGVAEIDLLAVVVRQLAVIHDLQEDIVEVGMRLLDLVEQQNRIRVLIDAIVRRPP